MPKQILFVCTGNTCRSSMAEYLFRHLIIEENRDTDFIIKSAGVAALDKDPAAQQAIDVMGRRGVNGIENHQATSVNAELIQDADLILTMTRSHKERLLALYPEAQDKIFTLKEYTLFPDDLQSPDFSYDIEDPFGQSVVVYQQCADEMEKYLRRIMDKI